MGASQKVGPFQLRISRLGSAPAGAPVCAHADFGSTDAGTVDTGTIDAGTIDAGIVARHVRLGATVSATFPHWTVLTDPAGQRYCLIDRPPRE